METEGMRRPGRGGIGEKGDITIIGANGRIVQPAKDLRSSFRPQEFGDDPFEFYASSRERRAAIVALNAVKAIKEKLNGKLETL